MGKKEQTSVAISEKRIGLDTPIVVTEILDQCLYSGFFGRMDSARVKAASDRILESIMQVEAEFVIIDLSNVDLIDSAVAAHLIRVGDIIALIGTTPAFCGITPTVAQSMAYAGVEFRKFRIFRDLKSTLKWVLETQQWKIISTDSGKQA